MQDDSGTYLVNDSDVVVCKHGVPTNAMWDVVVRGPRNCENGMVPSPKPDFSLGTLEVTGSAPHTADYVDTMTIKCFE